METNIQKRTSQQTLQPRVLAKQNPDSKTNKPASRSEYCQAARPATMKPATAKGAGGKGEALSIAAPPQEEPGVSGFSHHALQNLKTQAHPARVRRPHPKVFEKSLIFGP